jgi:hypothetical protein
MAIFLPFAAFRPTDSASLLRPLSGKTDFLIFKQNPDKKAGPLLREALPL